MQSPNYMSNEYLEQSLARLVEATGQTAEVLVINGQKLWWRFIRESPNLYIRKKAQKGAQRDLYELDALVRLSLSSLGEEKAAESFNQEGFFVCKEDDKKVPWQKVRVVISNTNPDDVCFDRGGNQNSIRRFVIILNRGLGGPTVMLSIAEAALIKPEAHFLWF